MSPADDVQCIATQIPGWRPTAAVSFGKDETYDALLDTGSQHL